MQGTAITDSNGAPLAVYHVTDNMEFTTFEKGDTGFHFGSAQQAANHSQNRGYSNGRTFRVYLDIKNPVQARHDIMGWSSKGTALYLWSEGVLTDAEFQEIDSLWKNGDGYDADSAVRLRAILESKGYDGIAYPNDFEGVGKSYMAFHDDQIIRSEIVSFGAGENASSNTQDRRSSVLQRLETMDMQTVDPRLRPVLRDYGRHLQQLQTIESLQKKQLEKITQLQKSGSSANDLQTAQGDLTKLEQMHAQQLQRLEKLEQNASLKELIEKQSNDAQFLDAQNTDSIPSNRKSVLENSPESNIISSGAISGAYNSKNDPDGSKRDLHADSYYRSMRKRQRDCVISRISKNTGIEQRLVSKMYEHLFVNEYDLDKGYTRFDADYYIAESVRRLQEGRDIQEHDKILVQHEAMEYDLMNYQGLRYDEAHSIANQYFNYKEALDKWLDEKEGA